MPSIDIQVLDGVFSAVEKAGIIKGQPTRLAKLLAKLSSGILLFASMKSAAVLGVALETY